MKIPKYSVYMLFTVAIILLSINVSHGAGLGATTSVADNYYVNCALNVSLVNQDPYPAQPNSYVNIVFQVSWLQNYVCNGSRFELVQSYPFSLDGNDWVRILPDDTYIQDYKKDWMVPYRLRIDKDALDGDAEVEVHYSPGIWDNSTPAIKKFNITIRDARTIFDAVLQDVSGSEVSIAIANAGKYAANAVVVRVPQQDDFLVTGTDGQMVGNLAAGDYTVVSFSIAPKAAGFSRNASIGNASFRQGPRDLKLEIYYTDNIGIRRVVNISLPYAAASTNGNFSARLRNSSAAGSFATRSGNNSSAVCIIVAMAAIAAVSVVYFKFFRRPKEKPQHKKDEVPDWIRKSRGK